jgi:hypothetical protein
MAIGMKSFRTCHKIPSGSILNTLIGVQLNPMVQRESSIPFQPIDTVPPQPSSASDWQKQNVKKRRQILLVATIGVLSSLLAGIGFFGFLSFMKNDGSASSNNQNVDEKKRLGPAAILILPRESWRSRRDLIQAGRRSLRANLHQQSARDDPILLVPNEQGNGGPIVIPSKNADNSNDRSRHLLITSDAAMDLKRGFRKRKSQTNNRWTLAANRDEPKAEVEPMRRRTSHTSCHQN